MVVIGTEYTGDSALAWARAGVDGMLGWDDLDHGRFEAQLADVLQGGSFVACHSAGRDLLQGLAQPEEFALAPSARALLERMAAGYTLVDISAQLRIGARTLDRDIRDLKQRLGADSRPELIVKAVRAHLLPETLDWQRDRRGGRSTKV